MIINFVSKLLPSFVNFALIYFSFGGWCDSISPNVQNPNWYYLKVATFKVLCKGHFSVPIEDTFQTKDLRLGPKILNPKT
jgi:hypothetical protein